MLNKFALSQIKEVAVLYFDRFNESKKGVEAWEKIESMIVNGRSRKTIEHFLTQEIQEFFEEEKETFSNHFEQKVLESLIQYAHNQLELISYA